MTLNTFYLDSDAQPNAPCAKCGETLSQPSFQNLSPTVFLKGRPECVNIIEEELSICNRHVLSSRINQPEGKQSS